MVHPVQFSPAKTACLENKNKYASNDNALMSGLHIALYKKIASKFGSRNNNRNTEIGKMHWCSTYIQRKKKSGTQWQETQNWT